MKFTDPAWRRFPIRTTARVALSLVYKNWPGKRQRIVRYLGASRMVADLSTALGMRLFRYGVADADVQFVRRYLREGECFVDCGANVGLHSLAGAEAVGGAGRVYSFEPSPKTAEMLRQNLKLSRAVTVKLIEAAVADTNSSAEFVELDGDRAGWSSFAPGMPGPVIDVSVVMLDDAVERSDWTRITLLKLDIEGGETAAVRGARDLLHAVKPTLLVEVVDAQLRRQGSSEAELVNELVALGYDFFELLSDRTVSRLSDPAKHRGPNLVCTIRPQDLEARGVTLVTER